MHTDTGPRVSRYPTLRRTKHPTTSVDPYQDRPTSCSWLPIRSQHLSREPIELDSLRRSNRYTRRFAQLGRIDLLKLPKFWTPRKFVYRKARVRRTSEYERTVLRVKLIEYGLWNSGRRGGILRRGRRASHETTEDVSETSRLAGSDLGQAEYLRRSELSRLVRAPIYQFKRRHKGN